MTYVITPAVKRLACRVGAMDNPNARKVHHGAVPRLGGLGIYIGFLASVLYSLPLSTEVIGLLMGSAVIIAVGIWDDICQIPAKVKLLGQILAAVVLVACGVRVDWILNPLGDYIYLSAFISVPLTILWVVGFTNMVNLIDGLDGLAAGVSSIAAVSVALIAYQMEQRGDYGRDGGRGNRFSAVQFQPREDFHGRYGQHVLRLHARRGIDHGCDENSGYRRFGCAGHSAGLADYGYGAGDRAAQAFGHADFRAGPRAFASPSAR